MRSGPTLTRSSATLWAAVIKSLSDNVLGSRYRSFSTSTLER